MRSEKIARAIYGWSQLFKLAIFMCGSPGPIPPNTCSDTQTRPVEPAERKTQPIEYIQRESHDFQWKRHSIEQKGTFFHAQCPAPPPTQDHACPRPVPRLGSADVLVMKSPVPFVAIGPTKFHVALSHGRREGGGRRWRGDTKHVQAAGASQAERA